MIKIGMLINDRYKILEKIGTGGMSEVYKARCIKLERFVAIKILRDEYCQDEAFVKRFKAEAQSAASLSHSNIVNIYDVGNEGNIQFIVMEYLEGKTLKEYIKEKTVLEDSETMKISACIASALEHAHSNHIIHRDIKPQNIIITNDGKVKVADFGIARIASEATIAVNEVTTGSVHYIAPEQARGGYCDEKSDIYSLGITMYEMATGEMPYVADSAVSVALKHIHDRLPQPKEKNPNISRSLELIILKATQKKPEMRYASANKLLEDLIKAQDFPSEEFVSINTFEDDSPTLTMSPSELEHIRKETDKAIPKYAQKSKNYKKEEPKKNSKDKWAVILGIITAAILVSIVFMVAYNVYSKKNRVINPNEVDIPIVEGLLIENAKALLNEKNIKFNEETYEFSEEQPENYVVRQSHKGLIQLGKNEEIILDLVVSKGQDTAIVPSVTNIPFDEAEKILRDNDFIVDRKMENHDLVPLGEVIRQLPEGNKKAPIKSVVTIYVSQGPKKVLINMPDVTLISEQRGISILNEWGLVVGETSYAFNDVVPKGDIITTNVPVGNEIEKGTVVNLVVSKGRAVTQKRITINELLGPDEESGFLEVYFTNESGNNSLVFSREVSRSEFPVIVNVEGTGKGMIEVFLNNIKKYTNTIIFDEDSN